MAEKFDILLDTEFDIATGGDFLLTESTRQHQQCLLLSAKGDYKHAPAAGINAIAYTNDDETTESLKKAIQAGFENDGMKISHLAISNNNIDVVASYED